MCHAFSVSHSRVGFYDFSFTGLLVSLIFFHKGPLKPSVKIPTVYASSSLNGLSRPAALPPLFSQPLSAPYRLQVERGGETKVENERKRE